MELILTRVVAEVGKTRICVHDASSGVDRWLLADCWPKRSSGVTWSGIIRKCESGSRETRQAETRVGACEGNEREHWLQISAKWREARSRFFRLRSALQPVNNRTNNAISKSYQTHKLSQTKQFNLENKTKKKDKQTNLLFSSPWPIRPRRPITSRQGWTPVDMTPRIKSMSLWRANLRTQTRFRFVLLGTSIPMVQLSTNSPRSSVQEATNQRWSSERQ